MEGQHARLPADASVGRAEVLVAVAVPALTFAYASGFALLWCGGGRATLGLFEAPGRMALTTYVGQTLVCIALFYGIGLGLHGRVGALGCVAIALALFALQAAASPGRTEAD